ncbi:MAG: serine/threonine protein kinase [Thermoproteota archaeon]|nr:serine/threonine protein kinase [Thermoproteota archaeon]
MTLSQQNISFLDEELDIRSPRLIPLISYPHFSECEYKDRIIEMESLGISSIILGGKTIVNGAHIAGKGCVGIVVKTKVRSKVCALKIRRTDADRKAMDNEAQFHKIANSAGVGPSLEGHTKNLIAMEFVTGQSIIDWVVVNKATKSKMCTVATAILEQCFRLDVAGLDHGELSRLARHVIVSDRPYIIDFESASTTRKTCNVTTAAQSILLYGIVANRVKKILGNMDRERVIHALRTYKHFHTRANFDAVLDSLFI